MLNHHKGHYRDIYFVVPSLDKEIDNFPVEDSNQVLTRFFTCSCAELSMLVGLALPRAQISHGRLSGATQQTGMHGAVCRTREHKMQSRVSFSGYFTHTPRMRRAGPIACYVLPLCTYFHGLRTAEISVLTHDLLCLASNSESRMLLPSIAPLPFAGLQV